MSQGHAAQLATAQHPATEQEAHDLTLVAAFFFHFALLALVTFATFAKQVSQGQATQFTAAQPAAEQEAYDVTFVAAFFFHFAFLALFTFTTFAEEVS
jgi:hypothetical protein